MNEIFVLSYFSQRKHIKQNVKTFRLLKNSVNLQMEFKNCYCTGHSKFRKIK